MADYTHADDGNIHTRYSELIKCTATQIVRVIAERQPDHKRFESEDMAFGTTRHDMWQKETERTGRLPECFDLDLEVTHCEQEFVSLIMPHMVLHSRPDAVCANDGILPDYKTMVADSMEEATIKVHKTYGPSRQLLVYAYQLALHNMKITKIAYLVEVWKRPEEDQERDEILGYLAIVKDINLGNIAKVVPWLRDRCAMLEGALKDKS